MFWLKGAKEFINAEEIELKSRLQFLESKELSEGSCAYINNLSDERVMIHWYSKYDTRKLVQTAELKGPMFINTAHPVTLVNHGDKSAVVDYIDLNTVIEHYKGI